jgi:hypothetical protein
MRRTGAGVRGCLGTAFAGRDSGRPRESFWPSPFPLGEGATPDSAAGESGPPGLSPGPLPRREATGCGVQGLLSRMNPWGLQAQGVECGRAPCGRWRAGGTVEP